VWRTFVLWVSRYWDKSVKRHGQRYQSRYSFRAGYLHFWHSTWTACLFSAQPLVTYVFTLILTVRARVYALLESLCLISCWLIYTGPSNTLLLALRYSGCATGNTKLWFFFFTSAWVTGLLLYIISFSSPHKQEPIARIEIRRTRRPNLPVNYSLTKNFL